MTDADAEMREEDGYLYDIDFYRNRVREDAAAAAAAAAGGASGGGGDPEAEGNRHGEEMFVIDARLFANATRFVNHGCDPNIETLPVVWESLDPQTARVAFFASRVSACGEAKRLHSTVVSVTQFSGSVVR